MKCRNVETLMENFLIVFDLQLQRTVFLSPNFKKHLGAKLYQLLNLHFGAFYDQALVKNPLKEEPDKLKSRQFELKTRNCKCFTIEETYQVFLEAGKVRYLEIKQSWQLKPAKSSVGDCLEKVISYVKEPCAVFAAADHQVYFLNPAFKNALKLPSGAEVSLRFSNLLAESSRLCLQAKLEALAASRIESFEGIDLLRDSKCLRTSGKLSYFEVGEQAFVVFIAKSLECIPQEATESAYFDLLEMEIRANGRISKANQALCRKWKVDDKQLVGDLAVNYIKDSGFPFILQRCFDSSRDWSGLLSVKSRLGKVLYFQVRLRLQSEGSCLFSAYDVTVEYLEKLMLKRKVGLLNALMASKNNFLLKLTPNGEFIEFNQFFKDAYQPPKEVHSFLDILTDLSGADKVKQILENCQKYPGKAFQATLNVQSSAGKGSSWSKWEFIGMSFQKGEPIEIYAIGQDATEKVMAEKRLIISLLQTRQIFESMTNAFISVDKNWCFTKVNKPFEKMVGKSRKSLIQQSFWSVFKDAKRQGGVFYQKLTEAMQQKQPINFEDFYHALGIWFRIKVHPNAEGLSIYFDDITDMKKQEEQLLCQYRKLSEIAQVSAHDLRGPVASILGLNNLIEVNELSEYHRKVFHFIQQAANNLDAQLFKILELTVDKNHQSL